MPITVRARLKAGRRLITAETKIEIVNASAGSIVGD
jgi:hypothetical protein